MAKKVITIQLDPVLLAKADKKVKELKKKDSKISRQQYIALCIERDLL